jgi:hypothetical protein
LIIYQLHIGVVLCGARRRGHTHQSLANSDVVDRIEYLARWRQRDTAPALSLNAGETSRGYK